VIENVRPSSKNAINRRILATKIRSQHLNCCGWQSISNGFNRAGKVIGAPILEVVTSHRRNNHMP
jgi:hypothetical protein